MYNDVSSIKEKAFKDYEAGSVGDPRECMFEEGTHSRGIYLTELHRLHNNGYHAEYRSTFARFPDA